MNIISSLTPTEIAKDLAKLLTDGSNSGLTPVFLISLHGAPLAQRASYLALHSSLFGPVAQLIMIILSLTALTLC